MGASLKASVEVMFQALFSRMTSRLGLLSPREAPPPVAAPPMAARWTPHRACAVARVFVVALGRVPTPDVMAHFTDLIDWTESEEPTAADHTAIASLLLQAEEFITRYGTKTACTPALLHALFRNALERDPTPAELAAFRGQDRVSAVAALAALPALRNRLKMFSLLFPQGASPANNAAYARWTESYDTLSPMERDSLAQDSARNGVDWPKIALLIDATHATPGLLDATLHALARQIHNGWTLHLMAGEEHDKVAARLAGYFPTPHQIRLVTSPPDTDRMAFLCDSTAAPFFAFLAPGDRLAPDALVRVARALAEAPETALLYTDEDVWPSGGTRAQARLKPGWSEDQLLGGDTVGQLAVFSRARLTAAGGFVQATRNAAGLSPSSRLYALKLALTEAVDTCHIRHLPFILFHSPAADVPFFALRPDSDAPEPDMRAVQQRHLARTRPAVKMTETRRGDALWPRVLYPLPARLPRVSVIIPTRDNPELLRACMSGLLGRTAYPALDVTIVDNGSTQPETLALLEHLARDPEVNILRVNAPFNWARLNNRAAASTTGELLLLLNDDIRILHPDWLEEMVRQILRPRTAIVGARLLYPDGTLQHGGVVLSADGATHVLRGADGAASGYLGQIAWQRDLRAVTGACLLIRRDAFEEIGGLNESFAVTCNDIDLCLRAVASGWRVRWTPHATLTHLDGATRGRDVCVDRLWHHTQETARLVGHWHGWMVYDPAVNPCLRATDHELLLACPPAPADVRWQWETGGEETV